MRWPIAPRCARRVALEDVVDEPRARGRGQVLGAEADQAARRNAVLEAQAAAAVRLHGDAARPCARRAASSPRPGTAPRNRPRAAPRARTHAVDFVLDDLGPRHRELVALAAHVLDQDGEVQLAAARHPELVRVVGVLDAQRDVVQSSVSRRARICRLVRNLPSLPANGDLFTWNVMLIVGSSTCSAGRPSAWPRVADRVGDLQVLDAAEHDDVAAPASVDRLPLEAHEPVELHDLRVALARRRAARR